MLWHTMEPILKGSQYIFQTQLKPFTLDFSSLPTRVSVSPTPITILKHKTRKQNQVEIKQEIFKSTSHFHNTISTPIIQQGNRRNPNLILTILHTIQQDAQWCHTNLHGMKTIQALT